MGISHLPHPSDPGLVEGMFLSNEPGYYEDGKFGIRVESIVLVQKAETKVRLVASRAPTLAPRLSKLVCLLTVSFVLLLGTFFP